MKRNKNCFLPSKVAVAMPPPDILISGYSGEKHAI